MDDDALKGRPKLMDTFSSRERSLPEGGLHFFFSSFIRGMDRRGDFRVIVFESEEEDDCFTYRIGKEKNRLSKSYSGFLFILT